MCQIGLLEGIVLMTFPKAGSHEECSLLVKMVERQVGLHGVVVSLAGLVDHQAEGHLSGWLVNLVCRTLVKPGDVHSKASQFFVELVIYSPTSGILTLGGLATFELPTSLVIRLGQRCPIPVMSVI
ncbi:uncharacterized protein G2W53_004683 [Senna tora]|uniref:Uncharacterized protein n=1 Tax=Senna tora TaxID=362788 RepID=A0A835CJK0_9FABA|nr:uncharacterized protein G2W53_004683 [Senna tora]